MALTAFEVGKSSYDFNDKLNEEEKEIVDLLEQDIDNRKIPDFYSIPFIFDSHKNNQKILKELQRRYEEAGWNVGYLEGHNECGVNDVGYLTRFYFTPKVREL
jgi:hypothetical protein